MHYFVKDKNDPSLDVKFNSHVDLVKIDIGEIEKKLEDIVELLDGPYPGHNPDCNNCSYHDGRKNIFE